MTSTNWSPETKNSTNFTEEQADTGSRTAVVGSPIGLLLALTYAAASTVTFKQYDTNFTGASVNSTNFTGESKNSTNFSEVSKISTDWS